MARLEAKREALDVDAIGAALFEAWEELGEPLDPAALPWLLALIRFESGQTLWNWNLGNITTHGDPDEWIQFTGNPRKFKAYGSLNDAARDFAEFIRRPHKAPILDAAAAGNFAEFWRLYQDRWVVGGLSPEHRRNFGSVLESLGGKISSRTGGGGGFGFVLVAALVLLVVVSKGSR